MNKIIKENGIIFGLILGFLLILPTAFGYAVNISILVSYWNLAYVFLIVIIIGIIAIAYAKKGFGGFISFKNAFTTYVIMLVISVFLSTLMTSLLFNVIDTNLESIVKEKQIEKIEGQREWAMSKMANSSEEQIDKVNEQIDDAIEKLRSSEPYSFKSLTKGFVIFIAIFSIFGVLLALILKRKNPTINITKTYEN